MAYFDLREGKYANTVPSHPDYLDKNLSVNLYLLSSSQVGDLENLSLEKQQRNELLNAILLYYQIHLSGLGAIKSVEILKEVFS